MSDQRRGPRTPRPDREDPGAVRKLSGLVTKPIPSSGEQMSVIGIGTAGNRFTPELPPEEIAMRRLVFQEFTAMGGRMLYIFRGGGAETLCGNLIQDLKQP